MSIVVCIIKILFNSKKGQAAQHLSIMNNLLTPCKLEQSCSTPVNDDEIIDYVLAEVTMI